MDIRNRVFLVRYLYSCEGIIEEEKHFIYRTENGALEKLRELAFDEEHTGWISGVDPQFVSYPFGDSFHDHWEASNDEHKTTIDIFEQTILNQKTAEEWTSKNGYLQHVIMGVASEIFEVSVEDILSEKRHSDIVKARNAVIYVLVRQSVPRKAIYTMLNKSHCVMTNSLRKCQDDLETNTFYRRLFTRFTDRIFEVLSEAGYEFNFNLKDYATDYGYTDDV
jgi:hypothetical protein